MVVSTRNRGASVATTVRSILACDYAPFTLIVIDQSDGDHTAVALYPWLSDPRLRYLRSSSRGLAAGHNLGMHMAGTELVAITDDDCEVHADWLEAMVGALLQTPRVGLVFGNVECGEHDPAAGYIDADVVDAPFIKADFRTAPTFGIGMGACFGVRHSVWEALGGFDEMLGPGAPFKGFEETDLALRALLAGHAILRTPAVRVVHHGFRTYAEGRGFAARNWYGIGAGSMKLLKCRGSAVASVPMHYFFGVACADFARSVIVRRRPSALRPIFAFLQGFVAGAFAPVDGATVLFRRQPAGARSSQPSLR